MLNLSEYSSVHAGDDAGFSWSPCQCCGSALGGDRFEFYGLKPSQTGNGMTPEDLGLCCVDCFETINN